MKAYSSKELRNNHMPLLRRVQRQIDITETPKEEIFPKSLSFKEFLDGKEKPIVSKEVSKALTKLGLFEKRRVNRRV